jgi:hypothetical protein
MIDKITVDALVVSSLSLITQPRLKEPTMERTTTGGGYTGGGNSPNLTNPKIEGATQAAHQAEFVESASASIRARPIATVAGALVIGYLLGRLARW